MWDQLKLAVQASFAEAAQDHPTELKAGKNEFVPDVDRLGFEAWVRPLDAEAADAACRETLAMIELAIDRYAGVELRGFMCRVQELPDARGFRIRTRLYFDKNCGIPVYQWIRSLEDMKAFCAEPLPNLLED